MSTVYVWNKYNISTTSSTESIDLDDNLDEYDERITDFNGIHIQGIGTWNIRTCLWGALDSSKSITIRVGSSCNIINSGTSNVEYSINGGISKTYSFSGNTSNSSFEYSDSFTTNNGKLYIGLLDGNGLCRTYINRNFSLVDDDGNYIYSSNIGNATMRIRFGRYKLNTSPKYPYIDIYPLCVDDYYNDMSFDTTYAAKCTVNNLNVMYKQGSTLYGTVESEDRGTYPDNGHNDGYWYVYSHSYEPGPNLYSSNGSIKKVKIYAGKNASVKLCDIYTCKNGVITKV